jgi:hypothetical protein
MRKALLFSALLCTVFTINAQPIMFPNGGFETWTNVTSDEPDFWMTSNSNSAPLVTAAKITGFSGQAIRVETKGSMPNIYTGDAGQIFAYTQSPVSITGYYRYSINSGDSANIGVMFMKNGNPISMSEFAIKGTQNTFTSFNLTLMPPVGTPDTAIVYITSSQVGMSAGSFLEVDQLAFAGPGITQQIPNGSFDNWASVSVDYPDNWSVYDSVSKTTDKYAGTYAAKMVTANTTPGNIDISIPYTKLVDTLIGYYKFSTPGSGKASVNISITDGFSQIWDTSYLLNPAASFTLFQLPLKASSTPSDLYVDIYSDDINGPMPVNGNVLIVDNIQLKNSPVSVKHVAANNRISIYPNPVRNELNIRLGNDVKQPVSVSVYNISGNLLFTNEYHVSGNSVSVPVNDLPAGIYQYEISIDGTKTRDKFIKQ